MKIEVLILLLCLSKIWSLPNGARIIGGTDAFAGEFPYAAAIYKTTTDGDYFCTGSLLSSEWVITAGQCVDGATLFTILLGTHKLTGDDASVERLATDTYVLHPDYDPLTLTNDIGLIKFRAAVTFTLYIKQLFLPYAEMPEETRGTAYGWGQISDDDVNLSDTLQTIWLTGVPDAECRITYGDQLAENMACFGGNYNEGTCFGDAGSPIIQRITKDFIIVIAVATFFSGNGCESTDPSGYTKIYGYNGWIRNVTGIS